MVSRLRLAVTGAAGLFGAGLVRILSREHAVLPLARADADVTNFTRLRDRLAEFRPDIILHAAAIPSPDVAELNPQLAMEVNVGGTESVVRVAQETGSTVALISSDAVFDGKKQSPYLESDQRNPVGVYGRTKMLAEDAVRTLSEYFIFRVSVLFGPDKANFISKGIEAIRNGGEYVAASDQVGSATYVDDAAQSIGEVLTAKAYGTFHLCNQGTCSRFELAREAASLAGVDADKVKGVPLANMNRPGPRVPYSVLEIRALRERGFNAPRHWKAALKHYVSSL